MVKGAGTCSSVVLLAGAFCFIATTVGPTGAQTLPIKVTSGLHYEEKEPQPIFYERTANIVYKFQTPTWTNLWLSEYDSGLHCPNDVYDATGPLYHCPVDFHQAVLVNAMAPLVFVDAMRIKSNSRSRTAYNCDLIQTSFETQYIEIEDFAEFLDSLRICSGKYLHESPLLDTYVRLDFQARHGTLWARYLAEFGVKIPNAEPERHGHGTLAIGSKIIHDFLLLNYHVESKRWRDALADCKSRTIPSTLVTRAQLNATLYGLDPLLAADNLEFSIPSDLLSTYYKLPITDCVFTDDALVVHIQVPIKSSADWQLLDVRPLPFYSPAVNEENKTAEICTVDSGVGTSSFTFDNRSRAAFPTGCSLGKLCHVLEPTERPFEKSCATVSLLGESQYVPALCQLKCQPVEYFQLPIFRKLAADRFVVTGEPGDQFVIQCPSLKANNNGEKGIQIIRFPEEGSVEVHLPCACELLYNAIKVPARHPCIDGDTATVYQLIPEHWNNFNNP